MSDQTDQAERISQWIAANGLPLELDGLFRELSDLVAIVLLPMPATDAINEVFDRCAALPDDDAKALLGTAVWIIAGLKEKLEGK